MAFNIKIIILTKINVIITIIFNRFEYNELNKMSLWF